MEHYSPQCILGIANLKTTKRSQFRIEGETPIKNIRKNAKFGLKYRYRAGTSKFFAFAQNDVFIRSNILAMGKIAKPFWLIGELRKFGRPIR